MQSQKVIGIIGGGQLGRMLTLAALPLGYSVIVIDPSPNCPASQVGAQQIKADLHDTEAIRTLAKQSDYITIEIEHLDTAVLEEITSKGIPVNPAPTTIKLIQDKFHQKEFLHEKGFAVADFCKVDTLEQSLTALEKYGGSMMLKTRHNAYDGRGNALVKSPEELKQAWAQFKDAALYSERLLDFKKELAVIVGKDMQGNIQAYPVVETVHERSICTLVRYPAQISPDIQNKAVSVATETVSHLHGAGVFGVELFLLQDDSIAINEIAPRVHNSGHITMNTSVTSQFEQHIRAISGLPLGSTELTSPAGVMINILGERNGPTQLSNLAQALENAGTSVYTYGKSPTKVDRKMGHINVVGDTVDEAEKIAIAARKIIDI